MPALLAHAVCFFFHCSHSTESCICKRCGRTKHLWVESPHIESCDFEFCGRNSDGEMVYAETVRHHYTCSRCGESCVKTTHNNVRH